MKSKLALFDKRVSALEDQEVHVFYRNSQSGQLDNHLVFPNLWAFYLSCDQWRGQLKQQAAPLTKVFTEFLCELIVSPKIEWLGDSPSTGGPDKYIWKFLTQKSSVSPAVAIQPALDNHAWGSAEALVQAACKQLAILVETWLGTKSNDLFRLAIGSTQAELVVLDELCATEVKDKVVKHLHEKGYLHHIWNINPAGLNNSTPKRFSVLDYGKTIFSDKEKARMALLAMRHKLEGVCDNNLELTSCQVRYDGAVWQSK